jgi:hypothetical protein
MMVEITLDSQATRVVWSPNIFQTTLQSVNETMFSTGAVQLYISGKSLIVFDRSPAAAIGFQSAAVRTLWWSDSCVVFKTARGIRTSFSSIAVTVMMMFAQISMEFTFLYPIIAALELPFCTP